MFLNNDLEVSCSSAAHWTPLLLGVTGWIILKTYCTWLIVHLEMSYYAVVEGTEEVV